MHFTKLQLSGFKSFLDNSELVIAPGMTGIVGPNGCGKSNLVEALRWVMGETSARKMRGGEMDDVIFNGTERHNPRNVAEVSLDVLNSDKTAPVSFNQENELTITRKIARGTGSNYRINGKSVRAKDVQLMFADNASGANSPSIVSQGRVSEIISAKPADRRKILEEAAGITGLHARRHEAELKLKSAETNLVRVDDMLGTMESQLSGLKRQARQAKKYRNLSADIRKTEAILLHMAWQESLETLKKSKQNHQEIDAQVEQLMLAAQQAQEARNVLAAKIPALRDQEASAASSLQNLIIQREQLEMELRNIKEKHARLEQQATQIRQDIAAEDHIHDQARQTIERLSQEADEIVTASEGESDAQKQARLTVEQAEEAVSDAESRATQLAEQKAAEEARQIGIKRQYVDQENRVTLLSKRLKQTEELIDQTIAKLKEHCDLEELSQKVHEAEQAWQTASQKSEDAEASRAELQPQLETSRTTAREADREATTIKAEITALERLSKPIENGSDLPPILESLSVEKGFEKALAVALGDALSAPIDKAAHIHWQDLGDLPEQAYSLPDKSVSLHLKVTAPTALERCLRQIGVVETEAEGEALAPQLCPGQILVTKEGAMWRWDGLTVKEGAPTAAAIRLEQRRRLKELQQDLANADLDRRQSQELLNQLEKQWQEALSNDKLYRQETQQKLSAYNKLRDEYARLKDQLSSLTARKESQEQNRETLTSDLIEADKNLDEIKEQMAQMPALDQLQDQLSHARSTLSDTKAALIEKRRDLSALLRDADNRRHRLQNIRSEKLAWENRINGTSTKKQQLDQRLAETLEEISGLSSLPAQIQTSSSEIIQKIQTADELRLKDQALLAEAELALQEAETKQREIEAELSNGREARAHAEAAVAAAHGKIDDLKQKISEKLECQPEQVRQIAELGQGELLPSKDRAETQLEKLLGERNRMGPVNLRAEMEAQEITEEIDQKHTEIDELTQAIEKLRRGINDINKEARERLVASFDKVNENFQNLFTRLFGGGKAYLTLTDMQDPLNSGLEIFASPPGKKLQVLSLLSGGEQALTATALIFAVFICNPAPICVLDEVDAPLDDANVNRFCTLVEEIAKTQKTRFLLITHHRLTMARMDRLYGVTMAEKGISQLVSVNLGEAEKYAETSPTETPNLQQSA